MEVHIIDIRISRMTGFYRKNDEFSECLNHSDEPKLNEKHEFVLFTALNESIDGIYIQLLPYEYMPTFDICCYRYISRSCKIEYDNPIA